MASLKGNAEALMTVPEKPSPGSRALISLRRPLVETAGVTPVTSKAFLTGPSHEGTQRTMSMLTAEVGSARVQMQLLVRGMNPIPHACYVGTTQLGVHQVFRAAVLNSP